MRRRAKAAASRRTSPASCRPSPYDNPMPGTARPPWSLLAEVDLIASPGIPPDGASTCRPSGPAPQREGTTASSRSACGRPYPSRFSCSTHLIWSPSRACRQAARSPGRAVRPDGAGRAAAGGVRDGRSRVPPQADPAARGSLPRLRPRFRGRPGARDGRRPPGPGPVARDLPPRRAARGADRVPRPSGKPLPGQPDPNAALISRSPVSARTLTRFPAT
jgi:hypothetical protein